MIFLRIQEALRFWRTYLPTFLLITLPFAVLTTAVELLSGPILEVDEEHRLTAVNGLSAVLVLSLRVWADGTLIAQLGALQGGRVRSLGECMLFGLMIFMPLALAELLVAAAMSIGLLMFILPGLWVFARLSLTSFAVALERQSPTDALQSSVARTRERQWELLGSWLLLMLFAVAVTGLAGDLTQQLAGEHGSVTLVVNVVGMLMKTLVMTLLFRFYVLAREDGGR